MTNTAIVTMLVTEIIVIGITAYFFYKVLTSKPKPEPVSYSENDDEIR